MPASTTAIVKNVERMSNDPDLLALWNENAKTKNDDGTDRTVGHAWIAFVAAADAARMADRVPGAVGRRFKAKYATEPLKVSAKKAASQAGKASAKNASK